MKTSRAMAAGESACFYLPLPKQATELMPRKLAARPSAIYFAGLGDLQRLVRRLGH